MPNMPTGPYRLEVVAAGVPHLRPDRHRAAGRRRRRRSMWSLAVGNLEETVSVEAAAPIVDVRSAGISDVVENERIVELPLQGRQVTDLIVLAGAAVQTGTADSRSMQGGVSISVAGGLSFGVAYLLDGATHNDPQNNAEPAAAVSRTRCRSSASRPAACRAQNGMHSGASVNAVTKSGTNALHGNAFEFLRDRRFNATESVCAGRARRQAEGRRPEAQSVRRHARRPDRARPAVLLRRLPGHALRQSGRPDTSPACPTAAMLAGDFTAFASPACNGGRADHAARAVREQPDRSGALQSRPPSTWRSRLPADDRSLRRDHVQPRRMTATSGRRSAASITSWAPNHSMFGRYMATLVREAVAVRQTSGNVLTTAIAGPRQPGAVGHRRRHDGVRRSNMVNALRVRLQPDVDSSREPDFFEAARSRHQASTTTRRRADDASR